LTSFADFITVFAAFSYNTAKAILKDVKGGWFS
jgi:hypothetical protein